MAKKSKSSNFLNQKKTFTVLQVVLFALVFAVLGAVTIWQTSAAPGSKGGGGKPIRGGSGTINGPVLVEDKGGDGQVSWNDLIRFNVTSANLPAPYVYLACYVNGTRVAQSWEGYFEQSLSDGDFGLSSAIWTSGGADCKADLINSNQTYIYATTSFRVYP